MFKFLNKVALALVASAMLVGSAFAEYPEKPVQFIVPWPPGDLEDVLTRLIAEEFQEEYDVPAAVVNKPGGGAGPVPGAFEVANAPADGYTVGSFVIGVPTIFPLVGIEGLEYGTFEPVGIFITYPFVLAARSDAPYSNLEELAAYAKHNKVALGHFGYGLVPTRITFVAAMELGFEFSSQAAFDNIDCNTLASGDADVVNTTIQLVMPCLDKIKLLASITEERISIAPNTPTLTESVPGLPTTLWNGLFVKKGTPQIVRDKIERVATRALLSTKAQKIARDSGALIYWKGAEESDKQIYADFKAMETIFKRMGDL
jgi:tripartite-type tricarboxylate transporter receptor subunit TctC